MAKYEGRFSLGNQFTIIESTDWFLKLSSYSRSCDFADFGIFGLLGGNPGR